MMRFPGHLRFPRHLHVVCVLAVLTTACASTGGVPRPYPTPAGAARTGRGSGTLVATALALQGAPYRNGGADPNGFDCSGFTQYVFARHGIALPRAVEEQYQLGRNVKLRDVESGDLVFFKTVSSGPSHVGIVSGDDQFIHAPSSRGVVRIERLSADYWSQRFVAARRIN